VRKLYFSVFIIAIILLMNNLATSTDAQPTDGFATIPDTSILSLSNSVTSSQTDFGLTKGNVFKIVQTGTATLTYSFTAKTATGGSEISPTPSLTIAHNLGVISNVLLSYTDSTGVAASTLSNGSLYNQNFSSVNQESIYWQVTSDKNNIYISLLQNYTLQSGTINAISGTVNILYSVLQPTRN
jgi:hypothetical protein